MLQNACVPCHDGRYRETQDLPEWKVPGHDGQDDAKRIELRVLFGCFCLKNIRRKEFLRVVCIEITERAAFFHARLRRFPHLAHLERFERAEFGFVLAQVCAEFLHELCAFDKGRLLP